MIDYGTRHTDLAVKRAEWRLSRVYHQAEKDIDEKLKAWQKGHERREAMYRKQLAEGKITQADFDAWMRGQVFQGKQWQARKEQIQQTLLQADRAAASIINEGKLGVFATNANYVGYGLEHDANINTGFTLYDEQTVARLVKSDPKMLPPAKVQKEKAYTYYNKLVNSSITQGIIQGEDIRQIARRIARNTGEKSYSSAVRNARTAYTGAQNAGRIEGLHQAQKLGIKVQKKWMATLDSRTRDAHADLDGQVQEVDDPFESDLGKIMFPGDPTADPGNVYNCRCTLVYVYPEYPSEMQRRTGDGEIVGDMTYREWEKMKHGEEPEPEKRPEGEQPELTQFNRYDPETRSAEQKLAQVNPNYSQGGNWAVNCQRTVVAQELVYRGYDVTAKPRDGSDPIKSSVVACWKFKTKEWWKDPEVIVPGVRSNFKNSIKNAFDQWGDGARAVVRVQWTKRYGGNGHFFTARYENGRIIYEDPQTNQKRDIDDTLKKCTTSRNQLWIMRVDNREVTDNVKYAVKNREDKNG